MRSGTASKGQGDTNILHSEWMSKLGPVATICARPSLVLVILGLGGVWSRGPGEGDRQRQRWMRLWESGQHSWG